MKLDQFQKGENIIVDANIFIYAMRQESLQCKRLLMRCANEEIYGILPVHTLTEVMHRLMVSEARDNGWITAGNPVRQLNENPEQVKRLNRYESFIRDILAMDLTIMSLEQEDFITAMRIQREFGLLTNDSILVAVAERLRVQSIASADKTLASVRNIILYSPDDLDI